MPGARDSNGARRPGVRDNTRGATPAPLRPFLGRSRAPSLAHSRLRVGPTTRSLCAAGPKVGVEGRKRKGRRFTHVPVLIFQKSLVMDLEQPSSQGKGERPSKDWGSHGNHLTTPTPSPFVRPRA